MSNWQKCSRASLALIVLATAGGASAATRAHKSSGKLAPVQTASAPTKPIEVPPRLFDFKGVPLEISLDEFRKLAHPDGRNGAKIICTGDMAEDGALLDYLTNLEKSLGVKKCDWVEEDAAMKEFHVKNPSWTSSPLTLADSGFVMYF